jgi:hypothetical protein
VLDLPVDHKQDLFERVELGDREIRHQRRDERTAGCVSR